MAVLCIYVKRLLRPITYKSDNVCLYKLEDCQVISKFIGHEIAVVGLYQQIAAKRICRRLRCTLNDGCQLATVYVLANDTAMRSLLLQSLDRLINQTDINWFNFG